MNRFLRLSLLLSAGVVLATATAQAQTVDPTVALATGVSSCDRAEAMSNLQRRLVEKASQGAGPLTQFIHRTRMIYQLDVHETVAWLDRERDRLQVCRTASLRDLTASR